MALFDRIYLNQMSFMNGLLFSDVPPKYGRVSSSLSDGLIFLVNLRGQFPSRHRDHGSCSSLSSFARLFPYNALNG